MRLPFYVIRQHVGMLTHAAALSHSHHPAFPVPTTNLPATIDDHLPVYSPVITIS